MRVEQLEQELTWTKRQLQLTRTFLLVLASSQACWLLSVSLRSDGENAALSSCRLSDEGDLKAGRRSRHSSGGRKSPQLWGASHRLLPPYVHQRERYGADDGTAPADAQERIRWYTEKYRAGRLGLFSSAEWQGRLQSFKNHPGLTTCL